MVLALTLTLVLTLELVQDSASQPYLSWMTMLWIAMLGAYGDNDDDDDDGKNKNHDFMSKAAQAKQVETNYG